MSRDVTFADNKPSRPSSKHAPYLIEQARPLIMTPIAIPRVVAHIVALLYVVAAFHGVYNTGVQASAADRVAVYYDGVDGKKHPLPVVLCPGGDCPRVEDFKQVETHTVPQFFISVREFAVDDYVRLRDALRAHKSGRPLPSKEDLVGRMLAALLPKEPTSDRFKKQWNATRDALIKTLDEKYGNAQRPSVGAKLPVLALSYEEAETVCTALKVESSSVSSVSSLITWAVTIPTVDQWQQACRGGPYSRSATSLHFPAWPTKEGILALSNGSDKDVNALYVQIDQLFDRIKSEADDFAGADDEAMLNLTDDADVVRLLERFSDAVKEAQTRQAKQGMGPLTSVTQKEFLVVCFLREVLRSSLSDRKEAVHLPLLLGLSTVGHVMEGRSESQSLRQASTQEMLTLLTEVDKSARSVPNKLGLVHMIGNASEWARSSSGAGAKPSVVGPGLFDTPDKWRRCLLWYADPLTSTSSQQLNGVRFVAQQGISPIYESQIAARMRESLTSPAKTNAIAAELRGFLSEAKGLAPDAEYSTQIAPRVSHAIAYVTSEPVQPRSKVMATALFASSAAPGNGSSVPTEELRQLIAALSYVEDNRPIASR